MFVRDIALEWEDVTSVRAYVGRPLGFVETNHLVLYAIDAIYVATVILYTYRVMETAERIAEPSLRDLQRLRRTKAYI